MKIEQKQLKGGCKCLIHNYMQWYIKIGVLRFGVNRHRWLCDITYKDIQIILLKRKNVKIIFYWYTDLTDWTDLL